MYTKDQQMYRTEKQQQAVCNIRIYRSRCRLCRTILMAMREMVRWREEGKLENLIKVADFELAERFRVYSNKLIPRKKEFTVKICNYIALAHLDKFIDEAEAVGESPGIFNRVEEHERLKNLFGMKTEVQSAIVQYIFGDQSTYHDPVEVETQATSYVVLRNKITEMEARIRGKQILAIEKCHVLHEMGRAYLEQQLLEELKNTGKRIVDMAQNVSHLWIFLGHIMMLRAEIMQKHYSKVQSALQNISQLLDVIAIEGLKKTIEKAKEVKYLKLHLDNISSLFYIKAPFIVKQQ